MFKSFLSVVNPDNIGIIESRSVIVELSMEDDDKESYMSARLRFPSRGRPNNALSAVSSSQSSTPKTPTATVQTTIAKRIEEDGRIKTVYTAPTGLKPIFGAQPRYMNLLFLT